MSQQCAHTVSHQHTTPQHSTAQRSTAISGHVARLFRLERLAHSSQQRNIHVTDIAALSKPSATEHPGPAYAFRAHLDSSVAGFVAWDRQDPITPGKRHTLRWLTGSSSDDDQSSSVTIEIWEEEEEEEGSWQTVEGGARIANSGRFEWVAPQGLRAPPLMRVRVLEEDGVEHVAQMMLSH